MFCLRTANWITYFTAEKTKGLYFLQMHSHLSISKSKYFAITNTRLFYKLLV